MIKIITESDLCPQDNPGDGWQEIEPHGLHEKWLADDRKIYLLIDNAAVEAIVRAGISDPAGILTDCDHLSHDMDQRTAAMGWAKDLAALDRDGKYSLAAWMEWTDEGSAAVKGKRYKRFSTEYDWQDTQALSGDRYRPTRLTGLALTNRPNNLGQRPITNRSLSPCKNNENQPHTNMEELKKIAARLGLAEDATLDDILTAIGTLQEATAQAQDAEAEAILNSEPGAEDMTDDEKEMFKDSLIENRDRTLRILRNRAGKKSGSQGKLPKYQGNPLYNRGGIGKPDPARGAVDIRNRAFQLMDATKCDYWTAVRLAKAESR